MEKTTLYLPADLHRVLRETARRERRSQAELIREAVEEYLKRSERPMPRSIGIGDDPGLRGRAVRSWIHEKWDRQA